MTMQRKIIEIDESRCNGCGICVDACHEGAIGLVDGKARLMRDDYCDGLGDCLPACPQDAITFTVREAAAYDEAAVIRAKTAKAIEETKATETLPCGCPGSAQRTFSREAQAPALNRERDDRETASTLSQWPVQLRLLPTKAPFYDGRELLVAADCTAFACGDFHQRFLAGRTCAVGCPKLDPVDYSEKLAAIIADNDVTAVRVLLMEVPCCRGLGSAVATAVAASGKDIPVTTTIVATEGHILD